MEQNRQPRNKTMHIWSINFQQMCQEYETRNGKSLQSRALGKLDIHIQKNETGPLSYMIHKNQLKMD